MRMKPSLYLRKVVSMSSLRNKNRQKGFSLIELLIVVAIIVIIITMAIPRLREYRLNANETSAVVSLTAINRAQISYQTTYATKGYADSLAALGTGSLGTGNCLPSPQNACLLDPQLTSGVKSGYRFMVQGLNPINGVNQSYGAGAAPISYGSSGVRLFCTTDDQIIRFDANLGGSTTPPGPAMCTAGGFSQLQ